MNGMERGGGHLDKIQKTSNFFSWNHPLCETDSLYLYLVQNWHSQAGPTADCHIQPWKTLM